MHATHDNMSIPNGNAGFRNKACTELTITELLADPLTGALMRADRVDMAGFHEMLRSVAHATADRCGASETDVQIHG